MSSHAGFLFALLTFFSHAHAAGSCEDRLQWIRFFEPAHTSTALLKQLGTRDFLERRINLGKGVESDSRLKIGAIRMSQRIETYMARGFPSRQADTDSEALNAVETLYWMEELRRQGALGSLVPFKLIARVHNSVLFELVEGQTIENLMHDSALDRERVEQVVARFNESLNRVKHYCEGHRLKCEDVRTENSYGIVIDDLLNGRQLFIRSSGVMVEAETGKFVIVDFD